MKIISISGLDGSGKSTQIELLKKHLEQNGEKVLYFHAIQFSFAKKLQNLKNKYCLFCRLGGEIKNISFEEKSAVPRTEPGSSAGVTKANWIQIELRKIFLLIDIIRFRNTYLGTYQSTYDYIVSDRYFYDSAINIKYLSKNSKDIFAERFIPSPFIKLYLEAEPALIMQRKRVPDQGLEYLREKRDLFEKNIEKYNIKKIDGNRTENEIHEEIIQIITKTQDTITK